MKRNELTNYLNTYLRFSEFKDTASNGLQVEGRDEIRKIVTGVSANVELFEKAIELKADAIIVHHGIIWDFEHPVYQGSYKKRIKLLLENDINLYGYHLPLDAHKEVGNNVRIAQILGLKNIEPFGLYNEQFIGFKGEYKFKQAETVLDLVKKEINANAIIFPYGPDKINTVGVISGGAQKEVKQAVLEGLDLYLTGEVSEHILHYVKEEGIHFIAAGHYATERFGVLALGKHIKQKFDLDVEYVDIPNPV
ncbi:MAG: Nif3-like dinuclear metal center hexameric protein [Candidatus Marinimicrobia bacterium]|nr:Nif3-like dinuclear metal center hexameric protein [Candidatus Neomarinimicrobiota bacterium]